MGERLVRLGHLVGIFLLLERVAAVVVGVEELAREALDHGLLGPLPRVPDQPADREGLASLRTDLDRDLVGGAADPAGFDLDHRFHVLDRLFQDRYGVFLRLFLENVQRPVHDVLGDPRLPVEHDGVDHLGDQHVAVHGIGRNDPLGNETSPGHTIEPPRPVASEWETHDNNGSRLEYAETGAEPNLLYPSRQTRRGLEGTSTLKMGKLFGSLCTVLRPRLPSVLDTNGIQLPTDDVITNARKVLYPSSPDHDHGVFLQVMPLARDVHRHLEAVGETDPGHLPKRGVRLLGGGGIHTEANPPLLGARIERRGVALVGDDRPPHPDKLVDRGHSLSFRFSKLYSDRTNCYL